MQGLVWSLAPEFMTLITGFGLVAGARAYDFDYRDLVWSLVPELLTLIAGFGLVAGARAYDFDQRVWFGRWCQSS